MTTPDQIPGYTIIKVLDLVPNFADVFLAKKTDSYSPDPVVIKWVRRLKTETELESIEREFKIGHLLEHPNIAKVFANESWNGRPYLVMEYMEGGSLDSLIKVGPLDWKRAIKIIKQVCAGVAYAHSHPVFGVVVHRDLSPDNIMFDSDNVAKIIDYGIASAERLPSRNRATLAAAGKPRYMSLEQMTETDSGKATRAMDIFTLGVVIFEMLTGQLPYGDDNESEESQRNVLSGKISVPNPSALNPSVPKWLDETVKKAIAPKPENRWPTVRELVISLELENGPVPKPHTEIAHTSAKTPSTAPIRPANIQRRPEGRDNVKSNGSIFAGAVREFNSLTFDSDVFLAKEPTIVLFYFEIGLRRLAESFATMNELAEAYAGKIHFAKAPYNANKPIWAKINARHIKQGRIWTFLNGTKRHHVDSPVLPSELNELIQKTFGSLLK